MPLYQMGNNLYHERILELALERPGVLTLHDLFLHHLLLERTLGARRDRALSRVADLRPRLRGRRGGRAAALGRLRHRGLFALPCHRRLAQSQRGVLVHSEWARDAAARRDARPRGARGADADAAAARGRPRAAAARRGGGFGIPEGAPVLGSFGFQTPIKRTDVAIAALARPGLRAVHLLVVGAVARELDLERIGARARRGRSRARRWASSTAPSSTPRSPPPTSASTCAIRPRARPRRRCCGCSPPAGPTLVSDYAQFTDLPRDCVVARADRRRRGRRDRARRLGALLADRDALGGARPPRPRARPARARSRARRRAHRRSLRRAGAAARRASPEPRPCRRRLRR